jgi:hypothetical protein
MDHRAEHQTNAAREFRTRAAEMTAEADKASLPAARQGYLELAEEWKRLAEMVDQRSGPAR